MVLYLFVNYFSNIQVEASKWKHVNFDAPTKNHPYNHAIASDEKLQTVTQLPPWERAWERLGARSTTGPPERSPVTFTSRPFHPRPSIRPSSNGAAPPSAGRPWVRRSIVIRRPSAAVPTLGDWGIRRLAQRGHLHPSLVRHRLICSQGLHSATRCRGCGRRCCTSSPQQDGDVPVHVGVRERGAPGQAVRPGVGRGAGCVPGAGPGQQGGVRDVHEDEHGDGVRRDHDEGGGGLREDRARHVPRDRVRERRRGAGRGPLQGADEPGGAEPRHCAGRARELHEEAGGDRRRRPGAHVRVRDGRDGGADAADARAGDEAGREADGGAEGRDVRVAAAGREDAGDGGVQERGGRDGAAARAHGADLDAARRDGDERPDRGGPEEARDRAGDPGEVHGREHDLPPEPVGAVRDRGAARRRGADGAEDHHRHVRGVGRARRRRVFGEGPDEGGPERRVHRAAGGEEHRGGGDGAAVPGAGVVRDRGAGAAVGVRGHVRDGEDPRRGDSEDREGELRLPAGDDVHQPGPEARREQAVPEDGGVRALRARRPRLHVGDREAPQVGQAAGVSFDDFSTWKSMKVSMYCLAGFVYHVLV